MIEKSFEVFKVRHVERIARANRHANAVTHYFVMFANFFKGFLDVAAEVHEVFADDFKPAKGWFILDDVVKMRVPQSGSSPERG